MSLGTRAIVFCLLALALLSLPGCASLHPVSGGLAEYYDEQVRKPGQAKVSGGLLQGNPVHLRTPGQRPVECLP
jgi:hypothetical protein